MGWTIKQISLKTGIPADTLRYYDKLGIVSPKRHENGYRYYDEKDLYNLQYVTVMKYAQFTLPDIKAIIGLSANEPAEGCNEVGRGILTAKAVELRQIVANYQKIIQLLEELLPMIDGVDVYYCNQDRIDAFVRQVYKDIRQPATAGPHIHERKE